MGLLLTLNLSDETNDSLSDWERTGLIVLKFLFCFTSVQRKMISNTASCATAVNRKHINLKGMTPHLCLKCSMRTDFWAAYTFPIPSVLVALTDLENQVNSQDTRRQGEHDF